MTRKCSLCTRKFKSTKELNDGIVSACMDLLGLLNVGCSYIKHLYLQVHTSSV